MTSPGYWSKFCWTFRENRKISVLEFLTPTGTSHIFYLYNYYSTLNMFYTFSNTLPWLFIREFLLIEASEALPDWINPENDTKRVWINNGKIYLLPACDFPDTSILNISASHLKPKFFCGEQFQRIIEDRTNLNLLNFTHTMNVFISKVRHDWYNLGL